MTLELAPGVRIRRVPGFPDYSVTTDGQVISHKHGKTLVMKARVSSNTGYPGVSLCRDGKIFSRNVHALVAAAFFGPRPDGYVTRHLDGNPRNNNLSNLCYGTWEENEADKERHGRRPKGEAVSGSKLTEADVVALRKMYADGEWMGNIRRKYPLHPTTIHHIIHGQIWAHVPVPDYSKRPDKVYPPNFRPRHKLSVSDVRQIRKRLTNGETQYAIADSFGVSRTAIAHIAQGSTWSTV